jgi:HEAT repeat protein
MSFFGSPNIDRMTMTRDIAGLIKTLKHRDPDVVIRACSALGSLGDPQAIPALQEVVKQVIINKGNFHEIIKMNTAAAAALEKIHTPEAMNFLYTIMRGGDRWFIRGAAMRALANSGELSALPELVNLLDEEFNLTGTPLDFPIRAALLRSGKAAIPALEIGLISPKKEIQEICREILQQLDYQPGAAMFINQRKWEECAALGVEAVPPLIQALQDRERAADASATLVKIGPQAIPGLVDSLQGEDVFSCKMAAKTLQQLGWQPQNDANGAAYWLAIGERERSGQTGAAALPFLLKRLEWTNQNQEKAREVNLTLRGIITAIGETRQPQASNALLPYLMDRDYEVRADTAAKLGKINAKQATDGLMAALHDTFPSVIQSALKSLVSLGEKRAIQPILGLLYNEGKDIRKEAADALAQLGWQPGQDETAAKYYLARNDYEKCAQIGEPAVETLANALRFQDKPEDKIAVVKALGEIGSQKATQSLLDLISNEGNNLVCIAGIVTLGKIGNPIAVEKLSYRLSSSNKQEAAAAAEALGEIGDGNAIGVLGKHLKDYDGTARIASAKALIKIYQKGNLTDEQKQVILQQRNIITSEHEDASEYFQPSNPGCSGGTAHTDQGIGLEFPL